jgi:hypothetical protein
MPQSPNVDLTSESTLTKLQEVEADLAAQETQLLSQLESIQEKRRSLQTVISLFSQEDTAVSAVTEKPPLTPVAELLKEAETSREEPQPRVAEEAAATATSESSSNSGKKAVSSSRRRTRSTQSKPLARKEQESQSWPSYRRDEYRHASLAGAVASVLQSQGTQVWETREIVKEIFSDELPKEVESQVRSQVTSILSKGVKANKWYRRQQGIYSLSEEMSQA